MPWKFKNSEEEWGGQTHELAGRTFTGATRTPQSQPLVWIEAEPKKPTPPPSKPKRPRKKQPPKPKGATAWD
jgi:hypothetical protein